MSNGKRTGEIVDELGQVKARIADLELREKELTSRLRRLGPGAYEGRLFRATVSEPGERAVLDVEWFREYVGPRLFSRHQNMVQVAASVRVVARNGESVS